MSDHSLVDKDVNINWHQYSKNGVEAGDPITEGYGRHKDEKQNARTGHYVPYSGWLNGITPLDDESNVIADVVQLAKDFKAWAHGKKFEWQDLLVTWADGFGFGSDVLGLTDPLGSATQWAVSWALEHITVFRFALDGLAGNPDAIAAYSRTWQNIGGQMGKVLDEFTSTTVGRTRDTQEVLQCQPQRAPSTSR